MRGSVTALTVADGEAALLRASAVRGRLRVEAVESVVLPADFAARREVQKKLSRRGLLGLPTICVLPSSQGFYCFHQPGVRDEKALRQTIRYEVEGEVPLVPDETAVDFCHLGGEPDGACSVLLAAAYKEAVRSCLLELERVGLAPNQVSLEGVELCNAYRALGATGEGERLLAIHFSPGGVSVVRLRDLELEEIRGIPLAGGPGDTVQELPSLLKSTLVAASLAGDVGRLYVSGLKGQDAPVRAQLEQYAGLRSEGPGLERLSLEGLANEEVAMLSEKGLPLVGAAASALGVCSGLNVNLLDGRQQLQGLHATTRRPLRIAASCLGGLLLVWAVAGVRDMVRVGAARSGTRAELMGLWRELHPDTPLPADPARALRSELSSYRVGLAGGRWGRLETLQALRRLSQALLAPRGDQTLSRIRVRQQDVEVEGSLPDYAAVGSFIDRLSQTSRLRAGAREMVRQAGGVHFKVTLEGPASE